MRSFITQRKFNSFNWPKFFTSWYQPFVVYAVVLTIFFVLRLSGGNNPIFLKLGPLTFRWYGIIITTGVIICAFLAQFLAERRGDDPTHVWRLLPVVLVSGIALARIWFVTFTWESYKNYVFSIGSSEHAGVVEIWRGGIAIQGAVIGGILGTLGYSYFINNRSSKRNRTSFNIWRLADYIAPGLVLAQAMGRWGNFMNNEAYGRPTSLPWGIKIPCNYRTTGLTPGTNDTRCPLPNASSSASSGLGPDTLFHPTFLYESLWDYLCFSILFWFIIKPKTAEQLFHVKLRSGDIFLLYWVIYSFGRIFTESLRTDSLYLNGSTSGLRSAQVTAIAAILVASFVIFLRHRKSFARQEALAVRFAPVTGIMPKNPSTSTIKDGLLSPIYENPLAIKSEVVIDGETARTTEEKAAATLAGVNHNEDDRAYDNTESETGSRIKD